MVAARLAVRQSYQSNKYGESNPREDGIDPVMIHARIALMAGFRLALRGLGPTADAKPGSSPEAKKPASAGKDTKASKSAKTSAAKASANKTSATKSSANKTSAAQASAAKATKTAAGKGKDKGKD